jgi:hypothetical protein
MTISIFSLQSEQKSWVCRSAMQTWPDDTKNVLCKAGTETINVLVSKSKSLMLPAFWRSKHWKKGPLLREILC